jgi:ribosomal protein S18 acetylase RimI-like enzyme
MNRNLSEFAPGSLRLRPEAPEDEFFLFKLYAGTRQEEMAHTGWNPPQIETFLKMQFNAMRRGYAAQHPKAQFSVVLLQDRSVGRLVVDRAEEGFELVDIALLPGNQGQGIGTWLLQELQAEAMREEKPIRLQAFKQGKAVGWYTRIGFETLDDNGVYVQMEWRPSGSRRDPTTQLH